MATSVRVQQVDRQNSRSFYINMPIVLAEAVGMKKGEVFVWTLEDKNTLVFSRLKKQNLRTLKSRKR